METKYSALLRNDLIDLKRTKQQDCVLPPLRDNLNGTLVALISCVTHIEHNGSKQYVTVLEIGRLIEGKSTITVILI